MPIFPPEFLEQIRARVAVLDLARDKTRLVRRGKNWFGCCPFHHEKTPSFKIDAERNSYYCFGCGAHGDLFAFVMESEKIDFSAAVELLADKAGLALPHLEPGAAQDFMRKKRLLKLLEEATAWFQQNFVSVAGDGARAYLTHRGIDPKMWEKFSLGFSPTHPRVSLAAYLMEKGYKEQELIESGLCLESRRGTLFERFQSRLIFPIVDGHGHTVGFGGRILEDKKTEAKYINSPESKIFDKSALLYGYSLARQGAQQDPLLIVEGYLDVIALHQAGFKRVVAPLGTAANANQVQACWRLCTEPIVMFDGDSAGQKAALRLLKRLLSVLQPGYSVRFAFLPTGEDPDSFVRTKGRTALQTLIQNALPLVDVVWRQLFEGVPENAPPEQRALIMTHMKEILAEITHADIRQFYKEALYKKWESYRVSSAPSRPSRLPHKALAVEAVENDLPTRVLLATLINHPALFSEVETLLSRMPPQDPVLECLKDALFDLLNKHSFEEVKNLVQELELRVPKSTLQYVLHKEILHRAPFVHADVSVKEAVVGFRDVWKRFFEVPSLGRDIQHAKHLLETSFENVHWKRLQELRALWEQEKIGNSDIHDGNDSSTD
ncbi:MAG: DNA primase [Holosporales bacterium]|nr:DNA primase [Holosporales bacterium]